MTRGSCTVAIRRMRLPHPCTGAPAPRDRGPTPTRWRAGRSPPDGRDGVPETSRPRCPAPARVVAPEPWRGSPAPPVPNGAGHRPVRHQRAPRPRVLLVARLADRQRGLRPPLSRHRDLAQLAPNRGHAAQGRVRADDPVRPALAGGARRPGQHEVWKTWPIAPWSVRLGMGAA